MFKRRPRPVDRALVAIYARVDALYLCRHDLTDGGLWTLTAEPAVLVDRAATVKEIGEILLDLLAQPARVGKHPPRDESTEDRRRRLAPLLKQAGVRSWKAFEAGPTVLTVARDGTAFEVESWKRMQKRQDAWEPDMPLRVRLAAPDPTEIGSVVTERLLPSESN